MGHTQRVVKPKVLLQTNFRFLHIICNLLGFLAKPKLAKRRDFILKRNAFSLDTERDLKKASLEHSMPHHELYLRRFSLKEHKVFVFSSTDVGIAGD